MEEDESSGSCSPSPSQSEFDPSLSTNSGGEKHPTSIIKARKICFNYPPGLTIPSLKSLVTLPHNGKPPFINGCKGIIANQSERTLYVFCTKQIGFRELESYPFYYGDLRNWQGNDKRIFEPCKELVKDGIVIFESPLKEKTKSFSKSPLQNKQMQKAAFKISRSAAKKEEEEYKDANQEKEKEIVSKNNNTEADNTTKTQKKEELNDGGGGGGGSGGGCKQEEVLTMLYKRVTGGSFLNVYEQFLNAENYPVLKILIRHEAELTRHEELCSKVKEAQPKKEEGDGGGVQFF